MNTHDKNIYIEMGMKKRSQSWSWLLQPCTNASWLVTASVLGVSITSHITSLNRRTKALEGRCLEDDFLRLKDFSPIFRGIDLRLVLGSVLLSKRQKAFLGT